MRKIFITVLHVFIFISSFELIAKNSELELIPRTKFYSSDNVWDVQINSNGSKIAYEAIHENHRTIWISSATSLTKGMPLKVGEGFQFRYFKWSYHPDYLIAFVEAVAEVDYFHYR